MPSTSIASQMPKMIAPIIPIPTTMPAVCPKRIAESGDSVGVALSS
jgi:hypothetical protein